MMEFCSIPWVQVDGGGPGVATLLGSRGFLALLPAQDAGAFGASHRAAGVLEWDISAGFSEMGKS